MTNKIKLSIFLWLLAGAIGAGVFAWILPKAPSANLEIQYDKNEAENIASSFLTDLGHDVSSFKVAHEYSTHKDESGYIQQSLEWTESREAIEKYGVQHWHIRFFQPPEQEEYVVAVHPTTGQVVSFNASLPDEAEGASLETEEASGIARSLAKKQSYDIKNDFDVAQSSTKDQISRRDHSFVWRHNTEKVGEAPFEVQVDMAGGKVSRYSAGINVPDSYTQQYYTQETYGSILSAVSKVFIGILLLFAIKYGLRYYKKDLFHSQAAWTAGLVVGAFYLLEGFNLLGLMWFVFPSSAPSQYIFVMIALGVGISVVMGGITGVFMGAGLELARKQGLPQSFKGSQHLLLSAIRGTALAGISLGFITLVMWAGQKYFGVWSPGDATTNMVMVSFVPALFAVTVGIVPAILEEAIFRLFGIPFLKKYVKYTFLAVVIMGIIFGLAHTTYPIFPVYTRAIEAGFIGIAFGFVFLRYGILTTLIWHFSYNTLLVATGLLMASITGYLVHGIAALIVALLPLLGAIGYAIYKKKGSNTAQDTRS